jgi:hypothetical protein
MKLVELKLGFRLPAAVELVPVKLMVVVVALAVTVLLLRAIVGGAGLPPVAAANVKVTPAGTPANVNRMLVPFGRAVPLFDIIVAVRQADALPSVITSDPVASGSVRFVKIVALALSV